MCVSLKVYSLISINVIMLIIWADDYRQSFFVGQYTLKDLIQNDVGLCLPDEAQKKTLN